MEIKRNEYATFSVTFSEMNKVSNVFSIGRARIFYIGPNRNRSIIERDVAEQLASTVPGTPIVGQYSSEEGDFEEHGDNQVAYGFVPLKPNETWVSVEEDGVTREYLEVDVVIWDGRFSEAGEILAGEKSLSMELNPDTLKGDMEVRDGVTYYKLTHAEFFGITVLGEEYEPCFEGAQFYSDYGDMVKKYASYLEKTHKKAKGGNSHMDIKEFISKFRLSADEKAMAVHSAYCTANEIEGDNAYYIFVENMYDDYALLYDLMKGAYKRCYFTVSEDIVELGDVVDVTITDVTETEYAELDVMKNRFNLLEEEAVSHEAKIEELTEENKTVAEAKEEVETKLEEIEAVKVEVEAKLEEVTTELEEAKTEKQELDVVVNEYAKKEKLAIVAKFSAKVENKELIEEVTKSVEEEDISKEDLETKLSKALAEQVLENEEEEESESADNASFTASLNFSNNALNNETWGLVTRFKENK